MTCEHLAIKSSLVICPLNTVTNWYNEINQWLRDAGKRIPVHKLYDAKNLDDRMDALRQWNRRGGIAIIHYDSFRNLVGDGLPLKRKASRQARILEKKRPQIKKYLLDYPDIVVCDEGN